FWLLFLFMAACLGVSHATGRSCVCWEGYKSESNGNDPHCVAVDQFHIMPCNMPKAPKCHCSGQVSDILKDKTGTWCTRYSKGEELMRWPCENVEEWKDFFKKHPDFI
ncbi:hypothetical protein NQ315_009803, partial [Exocentrus adspersus]